MRHAARLMMGMVMTALLACAPAQAADVTTADSGQVATPSNFWQGNASNIAALILAPAAISVSPSNIVVGRGTITFTDTNGGACTNRLWQSGDGDSSAGQSITASFFYDAGASTNVGGSVATYVASNTVFGVTTTVATSNIVVKAYPTPVAAFAKSLTQGKLNSTVVFTNTTAQAITNAVWTWGDGVLTTSTATRVEHKFTAYGTNSVILAVANPIGASSVTQTVIITRNPQN